MLDIIIPVYNEEKILRERAGYFHGLRERARLVFVDGESTDRTVEIARHYGEVVRSPKGRGLQKNHGARHAVSQHLLFLHVDACLKPDSLQRIHEALNEGVCGGCLTLKIEDEGWIFSIFERIVNFRARRMGIIDGDLGMFVRKDVFDRLGGFDVLPVMEDIFFSKRLRKAGRLSPLDDRITVSSRKWREQGFFRTLGRYAWYYLKPWPQIRSAV